MDCRSVAMNIWFFVRRVSAGAVLPSLLPLLLALALALALALLHRTHLWNNSVMNREHWVDTIDDAETSTRERAIPPQSRAPMPKAGGWKARSRKKMGKFRDAGTCTLHNTAQIKPQLAITHGPDGAQLRSAE